MRASRGPAGRLAPLGTLLALGVVLAIASPPFRTADNLLQVALQMSVFALAAAGAAAVILSGGIDLSVGSTIGLAGVVATLGMREGVPIVPAGLLGVAAGASVGLGNGALVGFASLPPFLATLGTMGMARGAALILTGGVPVFDLPASFATLANARLFGWLPLPVLGVALVFAAASVVLDSTSFGRRIYALGGNAEAARLAGVPVRGVLVAVYGAAGALAGVAGVVLASRLSTGQPTAGLGYELDVIAACVLGGLSLAGGRGSVWGALVGALTIGVLRNGCNLLDVADFWQQPVIGGIIVAAVALERARAWRGDS